MAETDMVRHPPHYNKYSIEVIEVTRHCSFNIGNAIKYMLRHLHKGTSFQDLEKALWYLNDHNTTWPHDSNLIGNPGVAKSLGTLIMDYQDQPGSIGDVADALRFIMVNSPKEAAIVLSEALKNHPRG